MLRRTKEISKHAIKVKRSRAGLGLFATETISAGMYIEYIGKILSTKEANTMLGARYLFEINSAWTIEGSSRKNVARYINHSCAPNCESVLTGKLVYIKALRTILPGEELCYNYGEEYFKEFIKPRGCVCKKCTR